MFSSGANDIVHWERCNSQMVIHWVMLVNPELTLQLPGCYLKIFMSALRSCDSDLIGLGHKLDIQIFKSSLVMIIYSIA